MPANQKTMLVRYDSQAGHWKMGEQEPLSGPSNYPKLKADADHVGLYKFQIVGSGGVTFDQATPFLPKGTNPPDFNRQFIVADGNGTRKLVVLDLNSGEAGEEYEGGEYVYQLKFSNGTMLDPIITNGGCCQSKLYDNTAFLAIGSIALLALAYLILKPLLARRRAHRPNGG